MWKDGIFGLIIGDALGVPVEFLSREESISQTVANQAEMILSETKI